MLKDIELEHDDYGRQLIPINAPVLRDPDMRGTAARLRMGKLYSCPFCRYKFFKRSNAHSPWVCEACSEAPDSIGSGYTIIAVFTHSDDAEKRV
jgi:ribosomal protein L37AE/L43A